MRLNRLLLSTALALPSLSTDAFDLPGAVPRNYARGERVDLYVSSITPKSKGEGGKLACESTMSPQSLQDQCELRNPVSVMLMSNF
jgi:hypothetical protein